MKDLTGKTFKLTKKQQEHVNEGMDAMEGIKQGLVALSKALNKEKKSMWENINFYLPKTKDYQCNYNRSTGTVTVMGKYMETETEK